MDLSTSLNIKQSILIFFISFFMGGSVLVQNGYAITSDHHQSKLVILVHGLMRTSSSMIPLGLFLEQRGYTVYTYNYPSRKNSIQEHSKELVDSIQQVITQNKDRDVYFVTHSMGGIITRDALTQLSLEQLKQVKGLVMLAPPNKGSELARLSTTFFPVISHFIKPLAELSSARNAYVHQVSVPKVKMAIIAGRYDAKVPVDSTFLNSSVETAVVSSTHTYIMNNPQTKELVLNFLEHGSLEHHSDLGA